MSVKGKRTIYVGPADGRTCHPLLVEGKVITTGFLPGELVERVPTGLTQCDNASTVFNTEAIIAKEYGGHTDQDVDTPYAVGDFSLAIVVRSGEFVNARVVAATYTKGQALASNGNGQLKAAAGTNADQVLFYCDEALTASAGDLVRVRKA